MKFVVLPPFSPYLFMNYKLEKFWNYPKASSILSTNLWTINLKSFEIKSKTFPIHQQTLWTINLKSFEICANFLSISFSTIWTINLKSFEIAEVTEIYINGDMNYKLEKFWNSSVSQFTGSILWWTINLKSFEIWY